MSGQRNMLIEEAITAIRKNWEETEGSVPLSKDRYLSYTEWGYASCSVDIALLETALELSLAGNLEAAKAHAALYSERRCGV